MAFVGSVAVEGYNGARLHEAGYNVKFYMRGEYYETCAGLQAQVLPSTAYRSNFSIVKKCHQAQHV